MSGQSVAANAGSPSAWPGSDADVQMRVRAALAAHGLSVVRATTSGGVTTLGATGLTPGARSLAVDVASRVAGVRVVRDEIRVAGSGRGSVAQTDAELAERVRQAIRAAGVRGVGGDVQVSSSSVAIGGGGPAAMTSAGLERQVAQALQSAGIQGVGRRMRVYGQPIEAVERTPVYRRVAPAYQMASMAPAPSVATERRKMCLNELRRLGGPNAICRPPIATAAELQRSAIEHRAEFEKVLREANWSGDPQDLFDAIAAGSFVERELPIGTTFRWMALRQNGVATVVLEPCWNGDGPLPGFELTVTSNDHRYVFFVPKACCNLALLSSSRIERPKATLRVAPNGPCITNPVTVAAGTSGGGDLEQLEVRVHTPGGEWRVLDPRSGPVWTLRYDQPGTYTVMARVAAAGGTRAEASPATFELEACPPGCSVDLSALEVFTGQPVGVDASASTTRVGDLDRVQIEIDGPDGHHRELDLRSPLRTTVEFDAAGTYDLTATAIDSLGQRSDACRASLLVVSRVGAFVGTYVGTERRWRGGKIDGDRSAPLIAPYGGVGYRVNDHVEIATAAGVAVNTRDGEHSSLFADVEANFVGDRFFVGSGVGVWDFNHPDSVTGNIFAQAGMALPWQVDGEPLELLLQGRLFTDYIEHPNNNYVVWGGVRIPLNRNRK